MLVHLPKALLLTVSFGLIGLGAAAPHGGKFPAPNTAKAIYLLTNDQSNAVVALPIAADGTLSQGTVTPTGGEGSNSVNAMQQPAAPDALLSQAALTIAGNVGFEPKLSPSKQGFANSSQNIFAVNAGSNTLSMLSINPWEPTKLTTVGQPASVPGQFPNTVAASAIHQLACVGTTGAANGVSCSSFSRNGLGAMDNLRSFDLVQTTPPVGPTNTVSQVFFSEDESRLFATVKGNPAVNDTGFFSVFPVQNGHWQQAASLATKDIRSSPAGTAVLFGSGTIPGTSSVFVTDASFGGAVLSIDSNSNVASTVAKQAISGQKATCWVAISPATGSAFVTDVAVNRLVEMSLTDASILSITDLSADGDPGLIDLRAGGNFVYALSPGNGTTPAAVTVLDVSGGQGSAKMIQHFALNGMGVGKNAQGMAIF